MEVHPEAAATRREKQKIAYLKMVEKRLLEENAELTRRRDVLACDIQLLPQEISFRASSIPDQALIYNDQLVFPRLHLNHGSGYNYNTGVFTAPLTGNYVFFVNMQQPDGRVNVPVEMFVDNEQIGPLNMCYEAGSRCSQCQVMLHLTAGQKVRMQVSNSLLALKPDGCWYCGALVDEDD